MASLIIQSPTAECYYKNQRWGKNKFKAFQDRKIPLQGKMLLCGFFIFAIILPWIHRLFFALFITLLSHNLSVHPLQSPSHFHSSLAHTHHIPSPSNPLHSPLLANAATLQHNWSIPKLRQA